MWEGRVYSTKYFWEGSFLNSLLSSYEASSGVIDKLSVLENCLLFLYMENYIIQFTISQTWHFVDVLFFCPLLGSHSKFQKTFPMSNINHKRNLQGKFQLPGELAILKKQGWVSQSFDLASMYFLAPTWPFVAVIVFFLVAVVSFRIWKNHFILHNAHLYHKRKCQNSAPWTCYSGETAMNEWVNDQWISHI